jgi:excisionase family DNA binding protein
MDPGMNSRHQRKILLTITEAAFLLGMGRSFVYELVKSGELPSIKLGRARRIPASALEAFIASRLTSSEGSALEPAPDCPKEDNSH